MRTVLYFLPLLVDAERLGPREAHNNHVGGDSGRLRGNSNYTKLVFR